LNSVITNVGLEPRILPFGESAILIEFGQGIHPEIHHRVKVLTEYLDTYPLPGIIEYVSAFSSVTIFYNPLEVKKIYAETINEQGALSFDILAPLLKGIIAKLGDGVDYAPRTVEIPVCYGGEFGPDLEYVAEHNKITVDEVIRIHASAQYLVYMIGFAPGFPYLGGMPEEIATPRRQSPRISIPAGTVGIAGMQTGVYPIATPGGWQLIGNTPLELFRPHENPPSLLQSGDHIRFCPISRKEYEAYKGGRS
jgi:inhibitor of KinA